MIQSPIRASKSMLGDATSTLRDALNAQRIAIFGASATPGKMGYIVVRELLNQGFRGELRLVNPKGGSAFGRPLVHAQEAIGADIGVIATPAHTVPAILAECGKIGLRLVVVQSVGFAEVGNSDLEEQVRSAGRRYGVRIIGPNCLGLFVSRPPINLTSLPKVPFGGVSLITQSGGLAFHVGRHLDSLGSGFDVLVSLGNKVDVGFTHALKAIGSRRSTECILLYMERLDEGDAFLDEVEKQSAEVSILVVIGGQTEAGRAAATSHTGSLLSRWDRVAGVLEDAGATVFDNLELATTVAARVRRGPRESLVEAFVACDGGGHSVLLADALARAGLRLHPPPPELRGRLEAIVGQRLAGQNPLDFAGLADSDPAIYVPTLEAVLSDGYYDAAVLGGFFGGYAMIFGEHLAASELSAGRKVAELAKRYGRPIVVQSALARDHPPPLAEMNALGIPVVEWPHEAAALLGSRWSAREGRQHSPSVQVAASNPSPELSKQIDRVVTAFEDARIPHGIGRRIAEADLPEGSTDLWVMRVDGFAHKNRIGAIKLPLQTGDLVAAYGELVSLARSHGLEPSVRLAPFIPHDLELIVTFWRSRTEGTGWLIGRGGDRVETEADTAVGRLPRDREDILGALSRTRIGGDLLSNVPAGLDHVSGVVLKLAEIFRRSLADVVELECNPIGVSEEGAFVLDALPQVT
jgi:acyl-CoA synthetase (NDP forming)